MTKSSERLAIDFLHELQDQDCEGADLQRLRDARNAERGRRRIGSRPAGRAIALAAVTLVSTAAVTTAAVLSINPSPRPPAVINRGPVVPDEVRAELGVFRRPRSDLDRTADARSAAASIRAPFVVASSSIRAVGKTPLGESAYVLYAKTKGSEPGGPDRPVAGVYVVVHGRYGGVGEDGPYPLSDIRRGAAFGLNEEPAPRERDHGKPGSARYFTGVVPDGVSSLRIATRDGQTVTAPVRQNVVITRLGDAKRSAPLRSIDWLSSTGQTVRTLHLR